MTACFMVGGVMDAWDEYGEPRVGAMMWRRHELHARDATPRPMPHLGVMTPAGLVCLDCPASEPPHGYWERTGEPPAVTVTPSLDVAKGEPYAWHGWLTNGELVP